MKKNWWLVLIVSILIIALVSFLGNIFTSQGTDSAWFQEIRPSITPPNFVFPIAWTIIFTLIALSLFFAWISAKNRKEKEKIALVFGLNFVFNVLWSLFYFALKLPVLAFVDIILVWVTALLMILTTRKINKAAMWMLVPYILWLTFAAILNLLSFI